MLTWISSGPPALAVVLASVIAWRSDPPPSSSVLVTVKTAGVVRSSSSSRRGRERERRVVWAFMVVPVGRGKVAGPGGGRRGRVTQPERGPLTRNGNRPGGP